MEKYNNVKMCPNCKKLSLLKRPCGRKIIRAGHSTYDFSCPKCGHSEGYCVEKKDKKMKKNIIGWIGMIVVLIAYFLVSFKIIELNSISYLILNVLGASGITYEAIIKKSYPIIALNIVWILIAIISVFIDLLK